MKSHDKAIATIAVTITVWSGVVFLSYLFHSFGILSGGGAGWMVIGAMLLTAGLCKVNL